MTRPVRLPGPLCAGPGRGLPDRAVPVRLRVRRLAGHGPWRGAAETALPARGAQRFHPGRHGRGAGLRGPVPALSVPWAALVAGLPGGPGPVRRPGPFCGIRHGPDPVPGGGAESGRGIGHGAAQGRAHAVFELRRIEPAGLVPVRGRAAQPVPALGNKTRGGPDDAARHPDHRRHRRPHLPGPGRCRGAAGAPSRRPRALRGRQARQGGASSPAGPGWNSWACRCAAWWAAACVPWVRSCG